MVVQVETPSHLKITIISDGKIKKLYVKLMFYYRAFVNFSNYP